MNPNMSPQQAQLWAKVQAFRLDEPLASFPFSARLARENDWSLDYTQRVIEEYKHFVFLAITAGHPVTPSVDVDQVWHLHLAYTRSYWEELCGDLLGEPLHHGPTKGGEAEGAKFTDWYSQTRGSYEQIFAHQPPPDIWPPAAVRFAPQSRIRQVSDRTHWIIRKPRLGRKRMIAFTTLAFLITTAFMTTAAQSDNWVTVFCCLGIIGFIFLFGASKKGKGKRKNKGGGGSSGCGGCGG
jgi:hypothetical protein